MKVLSLVIEYVSLKKSSAECILKVKVSTMAPETANPEDNQQPAKSPPFHTRFNILVGMDKAQERFLNRVRNLIVDNFLEDKETFAEDFYKDDVLWEVAIALGMKYEEINDFTDYVKDDFHSCLHALEVTHDVLNEAKHKAMLDELIQEVISLSEVDLGIEWRDGSFWPSGAKLLDEALVNENLEWLSGTKYADVGAPFEKGLHHLLEAQSQPEKLTDVITDMYEALEKMARITNDNNRTLGQNSKQFVGNLGLSDHYETMLREYTKYAHEFRHAVEQGKGRVPPLPNEVEAFVYTTGLFIRLAIQQSSRIAQSD